MMMSGRLVRVPSSRQRIRIVLLGEATSRRRLCANEHRLRVKQASNRREETMDERNNRLLMYMLSLAIATLGLSYASVPLYKVFCQQTGFGGTTRRIESDEASALTRPAVENARVLRITFDGQVSDALPWSFRPAQRDVRVIPGEAALAFYTAKNRSDHAITGIATYNVFPPKAGLYFLKVQCFCFDEQRLAAGEEVDMPVLFVIDPKFLEDPQLKRCNNITLSYSFFKTGDDLDDEDEAANISLLERQAALDEEKEAEDGARQ